jgi:hypothetical protein
VWRWSDCALRHCARDCAPRCEKQGPWPVPRRCAKQLGPIVWSMKAMLEAMGMRLAVQPIPEDAH